MASTAAATANKQAAPKQAAAATKTKQAPAPAPAPAPEPKPAPTPAPEPKPAAAAPAHEAEAREEEGSGSTPAPVDSPLVEFAATLKTLLTQFKTLQSAYNRMDKELQKRANKKGRGNNSKKGVTPEGFKKPTKLSKELCKLFSKPEGTVMPRNEVNKEVNKYIKEKEMQKPDDKRCIVPNAELKALFAPGAYNEAEKPHLTHFDLQSLLKHHLLPVEQPAAETK